MRWLIGLIGLCVTILLFLGPVRGGEDDLEPWVFAALVHFAPPDKTPQFPGFTETESEARLRYASIAKDIVAAVEATPESPGRLSNKNEAALLIAVAIGESRLSLDTDRGPCYRGKSGGPLWSRCDSGTSGSMWQLKTPIKWGDEVIKYEDTFKDRERAAKIALKAASGSLHRCRHLPPEDRLSGLGGACREGLESGRARYKLWQSVRAWRSK